MKPEESSSDPATEADRDHSNNIMADVGDENNAAVRDGHGDQEEDDHGDSSTASSCPIRSPRPILSPRHELQPGLKPYTNQNIAPAGEGGTGTQLNILLDNQDGSSSVPAKENGPEPQLSRRSSASNPLGDIASAINTPRAFFGASSKRLLGSEENGGGSVSSWLSHTYSAESSKASTTIAEKAEEFEADGSAKKTREDGDETDTPTARSFPPRLGNHASRFESVVGGHSAAELLREAGTSFTDEGTSVVSSWLEDATATGIFRSLHVSSEEISCGIPTPPSSCSNNSSATTILARDYSIPAPSSSWSKSREETLESPENNSNNNNKTKESAAGKAHSASAVDARKFERVYDVWRRKGLMSSGEAARDPHYVVESSGGAARDEKPTNDITTTTPTPPPPRILTLDEVKETLFEPDPSVASSRRSKSTSGKASANNESTKSSKIKSSRTPNPSSSSSADTSSSCAMPKSTSKNRRETLAAIPQMNTGGDRKYKSQHRQSLPATSQEKSGFSDILKTWQSKSANKPCGHFLAPQQTPPIITSSQQKLPETPQDELPAQSKATEQSDSSASKSVKAVPMPVHNRRSSSPAPPPPPARCPSPLNNRRSESPVGMPPKSQAWKLTRQNSERMISATSSAATKTAKNDKSQATTGTTHWSFGRSSPRGRSSLDRQSIESGSGEVMDKYAHYSRPSSEAGRNAEILGAKDIPKSISVNGAKTPKNDANALRDLARATQRLAEYFDPPKIGSADSVSTTTPSIPREVAIGSDSNNNNSNTNPDVMLSPFTTRIVRSLEKTYNQADEVRSPAETNFADRPWRRDSLVARVDRFQDKFCQCVCSESVFSGNDVMIDFFLPLMGTACTCGQKQPGLVDPDDPTSLTNILRPWQVEFLGSFGIYRGDELVKANHRSAQALAAALRKYRKRMGMTPFRTKSCGMALQIWSKTSKAFVRSIRSQMKATECDEEGGGVKLLQARELRLPNALYIVSAFLDSMPSDMISQGPGSSAGGCDQTLISTITGSHSSGEGATNWSTITPGATVEGEI